MILPPLRLWLFGAAAAALIAIVGFGSARIWQAGYDAAAARCQIERAAQEEANRLATRRAEEGLLKRADELSLKSKELDDALDALDAEMAGAAADDGNCWFGPERLRRLAIPAGR